LLPQVDIFLIKIYFNRNKHIFQENKKPYSIKNKIPGIIILAAKTREETRILKTEDTTVNQKLLWGSCAQSAWRKAISLFTLCAKRYAPRAFLLAAGGKVFYLFIPAY
jgi:hypothetical protein